ncbi:ADP-ribosylation factor GTPase-activating protein [Musa troglodytarum]|uniref:Signal recognition particle receptor subunit beta n=1 Tax=Musa troglodytarum TaxID=320322 RepID=A0A9E7HBB5_9LILI|nr:ADP-ribosylation factor GTPase-activating protein [Musa troglodytarum]
MVQMYRHLLFALKPAICGLSPSPDIPAAPPSALFLLHTLCAPKPAVLPLSARSLSSTDMEQWIHKIEEWIHQQPIEQLYVAFAVLVFTFVFFGLFRIFRRSKSNTIVLAGLNGSGKTVLFYQLRDGSPHLGTVTSMEPNDGTFVLHSELEKKGKLNPVHLIDVPGHSRLRPKLDEFLPHAAGVIFVVDSLDFLPNCRAAAEYLYDVLTKAIIVKRRIPILILCNKADKVTAHSKEFIRKQLEKEIDKLRTSRSAISTADITSDYTLGVPGEAFSFSHCRNKVTVADTSGLTGEISQVEQFIRELVLSLTLDEWSETDMDSMIQVGGNSYANSIYEAFLPKDYPKPKPDSSNEERTKFIRSKYVSQDFLTPSLRIVSSKLSFQTLESGKELGCSVTSNSSKKNKAQTTVKKSNLNPVWNEELKFSIPQRYGALKLQVYDHDVLSADDIMGEAEIDLQPMITATMAFGDSELLANMQIGKWLKTSDNALVKDSIVNIVDGKIKQEADLRYRHPPRREQKMDLKASDRFNINSQLEHLQAKYVGTGHADLSRFEWAVNIQRDSYASYIGHYPVLAYFAISENESIGRERYNFMQKMLLPCGLPPEREED